MPVPPDAREPDTAEASAPVKSRGRLFAVIGLLCVCVGLGLASLLISQIYRSHQSANRVKCRQTMRALGSALMLYVSEHKVYPPSLKAVFLSQDISPDFLHCPSVDRSHYTRADLEADNPSLRPGAPGTYIYVGDKVKASADAGVVLMYESMSNHGDGFHLLFSDDHVEFLGGERATKVQSELQAGQNPPPSY